MIDLGLSAQALLGPETALKFLGQLSDMTEPPKLSYSEEELCGPQIVDTSDVELLEIIEANKLVGNPFKITATVAVESFWSTVTKRRESSQFPMFRMHHVHSCVDFDIRPENGAVSSAAGLSGDAVFIYLIKREPHLQGNGISVKMAVDDLADVLIEKLHYDFVYGEVVEDNKWPVRVTRHGDFRSLKATNSKDGQGKYAVNSSRLLMLYQRLGFFPIKLSPKGDPIVVRPSTRKIEELKRCRSTSESLDEYMKFSMN